MLATFLVRPLAFGKRLVVHPAVCLKLLLKDTALTVGEIDAILEGFLHPFTIAQACVESKRVLNCMKLKLLNQRVSSYG